MSAPFTPGPWKRTGGAGVSASMMSETLKSGRRVCRRVAVAMGETIVETESNARLIAAAPDLYDALEECLREHGGFTIKGGVQARAMAALLKARGAKP